VFFSVCFCLFVCLGLSCLSVRERVVEEEKEVDVVVDRRVGFGFGVGIKF